MQSEKWTGDSFLLGIVSGFISITGFYYLTAFIRTTIISSSGNQLFLKPPSVQMISTALNIMIFRILMVNLKKEKTGRGFLMSTVISFFVYFYFYSRMK